MEKVAKSTEVVLEQKVALYVKGQNDKEFRTSDGFFRDPFTGAELTGNEERLQLGTRTPRIADSKGNAIPISYRLWTKEEREAYKATLNSPSSKSGSSSTKNNQLRKSLLELKAYLSERLPDDENVAKMIDDLLPPDPEQQKLFKQVEKMSAETKELLARLLKA